MKTRFESGKSIKELGIDTTRKFVVVAKEHGHGFKIGEVVTYDSGDTNYYHGRFKNANTSWALNWDEVAYADDSVSVETTFVRGERVMTEDGEMTYITHIEGHAFPYIVLATEWETDFNEGKEFYTCGVKTCSKLHTVTEMTIEQVELALGRKIKIVA